MALQMQDSDKLRADVEKATGLRIASYVTKVGLQFIANKHKRASGKKAISPKPALTKKHRSRKRSVDTFITKSKWIIYLVCRELNVKEEILLSKSRLRPITQTRHIAIALVKKHTNLSLSQTGKNFSRDHTTVIHSLRRYDGIKEESRYKNPIANIEQRIPEYDKRYTQ